MSLPVRENQAVGGVDLGVSRLATLSDSSCFEGPKALHFNLARLKRLSRDAVYKEDIGQLVVPVVRNADPLTAVLTLLDQLLPAEPAA